jgi:hypothetical protein
MRSATGSSICSSWKRGRGGWWVQASAPNPLFTPLSYRLARQRAALVRRKPARGRDDVAVAAGGAGERGEPARGRCVDFFLFSPFFSPGVRRQ